MPLSTRLSASVHILTILAVMPDQFVSATRIAESLDTNRVVVSRLLSKLNEAGFVISQQGINGGARLAKKPEEIPLNKVFEIVEDPQFAPLHTPNLECPIAQAFVEVFGTMLAKAEGAFHDELAKITLADLVPPALEALQLAESS